jgi:hypothetical protein
MGPERFATLGAPVAHRYQGPAVMRKVKPASASAQQLDDNASKRLAAHRKERELRSGPLLDRLRIGELKTIAEDARAAGDIDNRVAAERLFACAVPHLLALPTITRRGFKGAGDLGQFAHDFAPAFYRSKGSRYFDDLRHEFDTVLKRPRRMKADHIAHRLGITLAKRAHLGLQTIGANDKPKAERKADRKTSNAAYQLARRKANGAKPHSESAARTKPWEALGLPRATYYRRRAKALVSLSETDSKAVSDVVTRSSVDESVSPSTPALAPPSPGLSGRSGRLR